MEHSQNVVEFFSGRHVFVTGFSGFLGKVLIEKLLRSCPDIGNIYVLLREKRQKSLEERLKKTLGFACFDKIRDEGNGHLFEKIIPMKGDIGDIGLGLFDEDRNVLLENVSVVFHSAASVRFDDSLKDAILLNTRGTREVVKLTLQMKNIAVLAHISTAFSNCDRDLIEERLYEPLADWSKTIELAESTDHYTLDALTAKCIGHLPNTYTFAKHLAEHVVKDMCQDKIRAFILRPSIVCSSLSEPFPGWIDNYNGSVGLAVGAGLGVMRCLLGDPKANLNNVPVDTCIKAAIIGAWHIGTNSQNEKFQIYNAANVIRDELQSSIDLIVDITSVRSSSKQIWRPNVKVIKSTFLHFWYMLSFQILPSCLLDLVLVLCGRKPMLFSLQRKVFVANLAVKYFISNDIIFIDRNFLELENKLSPKDAPIFSYGLENFSDREYFLNGAIAGRKCLLREDPKEITASKDKKRGVRMYYIYHLVCTITYLALIWLVFVKLNVISHLFDYIKNVVYL